MAIVLGQWWISEDGLDTQEDSIRSVRSRQAVLTTRRKSISSRVYKLRTAGFDSRVRDTHGAKAWNTPEEPDPTDIGDWISHGTTYRFDPSSGEVTATNASIRLGDDWDDAVPLQAEEGV